MFWLSIARLVRFCMIGNHRPFMTLSLIWSEPGEVNSGSGSGLFVGFAFPFLKLAEIPYCGG